MTIEENQVYKDILKKHKLRATDCRIDILDQFNKSKHALSFRDIEEKYSQYDRVTIYRTLNSFIEKGMLHKIPNETGIAKFGLCTNTCEPEDHHHNHIHFKCDICGEIDCLEGYKIPEYNIPNHIVHETNVIVNGICQLCSKKIGRE
ncbi:MAG TPA: transcriptional repressor [Cytophagales bacterium]|jgi:Fur family ferric uptake transcriptional regulator|nr:transcriptional repressor [Cytophagales bacterium]